MTWGGERHRPKISPLDEAVSVADATADAAITSMRAVTAEYRKDSKNEEAKANLRAAAQGYLEFGERVPDGDIDYTNEAKKEAVRSMAQKILAELDREKNLVQLYRDLANVGGDEARRAKIVGEITEYMHSKK